MNSRRQLGILSGALAIAAVALWFKLAGVEHTLANETAYPDELAHAAAPVTAPERPIADAFAPVRVTKTAPGHVLVDFGAPRFAALRIRSKTPTTLTVTLAERISADGQAWLYDPARGPEGRFVSGFRQTLILSADHREGVVGGPPRARPAPSTLPDGLPSVFPFRYAEIRGGDFSALDIAQVAVRHPYDAADSRFSSDSAVLNAMWGLAKHTIEATSFAGLYIDGNRERKPYEADAFIAQLSDLSLHRDTRPARATLEYLLAHPTWPTEWVMFPVLMAANDFRYTGDTAFLRRVYPALKDRALLELERPDHLIATAKPPAALLAKLHLTAMTDIVDWPASERDGYERRPVAPMRFAALSLKAGGYRTLSSASRMFGLRRSDHYYRGCADDTAAERYRLIDATTVVNAFHFAVLENMAAIAAALGYSADTRFYASRAAAAKAAIQTRLFDAKAGLFVDGDGGTHHSLHANLFALRFGLVPPAHRASVVAFVKAKGMGTSVYGAQFLLDALYMADETDAAHALLTATGTRSWYDMLRQGAGMTTEAWSLSDKPNEDWNHAWGTAPANLIARWVMGIQPSAPGFTRFVVRPQPGALARAEIAVPTPAGPIVEQFRRDDATFAMTLAVPPHTQAEVSLPLAGLAETCTLAAVVDGHAVAAIRQHGFLLAGIVGPGRHAIAVTGRACRNGDR